ncbi:MAG: gliding motility-associated C-terminal domain-containing protein, partial [Bacteroidales bacterium]|nr:gliding motility-associated C-terminal domain-containing protein [Bacteroidales bacterium]
DMPDDPQYIHLDSLSTRNGNIHLSFSIDEDSELHRYVLLRSQGVRKGTYDTIKSYDQPGSTIRYIDESVDATRNRYYYHLAAVNQCGALTTRSDTLNNLVLTVTQQNLTHQLDWNEIRYLPGVVYQVYRKGGDTDSYQIHLSTGRQAYLDTDIQHFKYDMVSKKSEFCYYVRAKINHTTDRQSVITSNKRCVYAEPQIFLPNAFIPNARMQENRGFKPEFSFVPQHYLLIIYDRMGRKVFQSADPEDKWEGKIQGGQKAPAGTYTYYLEVKNPGAPLIRKRGEITLIYR